MKNQDARRAEIEDVALRVLAERGYDGASMLTIAKAAKASNETLYRWYGDKAGLFGEIVKGNAAQTQATLDAAIEGDDTVERALAALAPVLLGLLVGERSVLLNRAAASDPSGVLGQLIAKGGREAVFPRIIALMTEIDPDRAGTLAGWFLSLLVGDLQVRRIIGTLPPLSAEEISARADAALEAFWVLAAQSS
ncbi:TetR family transcriptional regulator [Litoreibacter ponti]|uniref:TetR family transcriptional regulator n=1 Tax=Litoreibacter ponti TaxID=1510457 RepID=A0A2T6BHK3_9RHOB|nr:TetR/AcrR family transcriptional regulator [Litoreibacter ponti]PTX55553.1 TetR family transcriptional regulator [Litoreibacter ponti]